MAKQIIGVAKQHAKRRVLIWVLGGALGFLMPILGWIGLFFLIIVAFFMVFGGLIYHAQKVPPPLPDHSAYSTQWLNLIQHVDTANGFFLTYPAVWWVADIQAASGGMPLDRTRSGGYGLFDLPHAKQMGRPLLATNAFALDLREHQVAKNLQATLNGVGTTLKPSRSNWSGTVRSHVNVLESGPQIVAWPAVMSWKAVATNPAATRFGQTPATTKVVWVYPQKSHIFIVATASAPIGNKYKLNWTPPYRVCPPPPPHSTKAPPCYWVHDYVTGRDILGPSSMTLKTSSGQVVPMQPIEGPNKTDGFVFRHAVLYVTASKVLVNKSHVATITAHWPNGQSVSTTLPGNGFGQGSGGPVGPTPPPGSPGTLTQIYQRYKAAIKAASAATGVPVPWLVAEAYVESKGVNYPYAGPSVACGVWQMFSPGSFTQYSPGSPPADCAVPSIEAPAAAGFLAALHAEFGTWRAASASYYGGPGNVQSSGVSYGMPWNQASGRLNWVPAPGAGNTLTMTDYADEVYSNAVAFAKAEHMPKNF